MVKFVKFKGGSGKIHKVSEREFKDLKSRGEKLIVTKSVTRKRRKSNNDFFSGGGFF